ncbi:cytochrome P450 [Actinosynnema sp. NPDC050436]|uniref:cytochrome P450 n=1 Tax=Actinosynnema sp. NPDC050436 TaxID=3155659 RepID=UPI0033C73778
MKRADRRQVRRDPLAYLEQLRRVSTTGVIALPWGGWCVSDPALAQELLRHPGFHDGKSTFFRHDLLPTRAAQVQVGHAVRDVLRARLPEYRAALDVAVTGLPATSRWPAAGAGLVYRCLADLLLHPLTPAGARSSMDRAARAGVLRRPARVWQRARAEVWRGRLVTALVEQVADRRAHPADRPRDVLDAVVGACPDEVGDRAVAELYLALFRAVVTPVGTSLAWSVLLACLHHPADAPWPWPADQVVREALRHRPTVWMVGRTVSRPTEFGGVPVRPGELLSVSPYLLHHDERHWADPAAFRPERWAAKDGLGPYLPFGAGPFTCVGAAVAQVLTTEALAALAGGARLAVTRGDARPSPGLVDGASPRPFTVHRTVLATGGPDHAKGGDLP